MTLKKVFDSDLHEIFGYQNNCCMIKNGKVTAVINFMNDIDDDKDILVTYTRDRFDHHSLF